MSCASAFKADIPLSCLIAFVGAVRAEGPTAKNIKQGLWVGGCLMDKFVPEDDVPKLMEHHNLLDQAEEILNRMAENVKITNNSANTLAISEAQDAVSKDWTIIVPIIFEIIKMLLENRKKKQTVPSVSTTVVPKQS